MSRTTSSPFTKRGEEEEDVSFEDPGRREDGDADEWARDRPLYAMLGVPPDASGDEIRRAYRQAASVIHPDKVREPSLREEAARTFAELQHAHEVLSDPAKRDVYDIYGEEGLKAGMDLVDAAGKSREELRKEWEAFRAREHRERVDTSVNFRGKYVFRVDATAFVRPYSKHVARHPEISSVYMTSGVDVPLENLTPENVMPVVGERLSSVVGADRDVLHLGGIVFVRRSEGQGSFIAGYKRAWSNYTTFDAQAVVGLRTLLSAQTSVQLTPNSTATLATTWQPKVGPGLQFITTRQLSERTQGEFSWVIGPRAAAGMGLAVSHRTEKMLISGGVDVGSATGVHMRIIRQLSETATGRISVKVGLTGAEIDVGGSKRINNATTAGMYVVAGTKGVLLRLRYSRGGHIFEFPITLSSSFDASMLAAAAVIPSAMLYIGSEWVARPLSEMLSSRRSLMERRQRATEIRLALDQAMVNQTLLKTVASRRARKAAADGGLVIVLALYGEEATVKKTAGARLKAKAETVAPTKNLSGRDMDDEKEMVMHSEEGSSSRGGGAEELPSESKGPGNASDAEDAGTNSDERLEQLAPSIIEVTIPLQYLSDTGKLELHKGYSKSKLMGFCDPCPGSSKLLMIFYSFQNSARVAMIADTDGAVLPMKGNPAEETERRWISALVSSYR